MQFPPKIKIPQITMFVSPETTLLKAKYLVTNTSSFSPQVIVDGAVLIEGNKIIQVGSQNDISMTTDYVYDFGHHVILPGLVNAHSHAAMTLFRGYADDLPLQEWLNDYIWPIERKMTKDDVFIGAKLAAAEALLSGTTLFNSQYWHPSQEADAFKEVGVRLTCGPPTLSGMAKLTFPTELISVSPEGYQKINDFVAKFNAQRSEHTPPMIVHTHVAEAADEMMAIHAFAEREGFSIKSEIKTPVQYMDSIGALTPFTLAAHAIEVPANDQRILAERKVSVSINTESNMKLANSVAPAKEYLNLEMNVGLGTDSACSNNALDMFSTMKSTAIVQKGFFKSAVRLPAPTVLSMGTVGGASAMGWDNIGDLKPGYYADIVAVDLNSPHLRPIPSEKTLISHLVYAAKGSDVTDVMVGGTWKLRNRNLMAVDLPTLLEEFETKSLDLLSR